MIFSKYAREKEGMEKSETKTNWSVSPEKLSGKGWMGNSKRSLRRTD